MTLKATVSITTPRCWPLSKKFECADLDDLLTKVKEALAASDPELQSEWRFLTISVERPPEPSEGG